MDVEENGIVSLWALMVYEHWLADYSQGSFFGFLRYRYSGSCVHFKLLKRSLMTVLSFLTDAETVCSQPYM